MLPHPMSSGPAAPSPERPASPASPVPRRRRLTGPISAGVVAIVATLMLFGPSLVGGKIFAGTDQILADPLAATARPPSLVRISNILSYDSVHVFHPDLLSARE